MSQLSLPSHIVEEPCECCESTGRIFDGPPWETNVRTEQCPDCGGAGKLRRDYLKEAFLIVQGRSLMIPERKHLESVVNHCRELASAALALPEPRKPTGREVAA